MRDERLLARQRLVEHAVAADVEPADHPAQRDERRVVRDDRGIRAQAEHDAAVGNLSKRHVCAGLHRGAVHTERHAQRFRARDVSRRDVIDVPERPAQAVEALGFAHRFQGVEQVGHR